MRRALTVVLAVVLMGMCVAVFAGDIVTMPTANQLRKGQVDFAYYYLSFDFPAEASAPESLQAQTIYLGITDEIELDVHRYDPNIGSDSVIINASYSLMRETLTKPDVVVGGRNIFGKNTSPDPASGDRSYFISAAKTLGLPPAGPPKPPFVRIHASLGTADPSLLGEDRHKGLFGGVQALLTPTIGAIVLHDGADLITGLTYTPKTIPLTIKGGGFGDHWWLGLSYAK